MPDGGVATDGAAEATLSDGDRPGIGKSRGLASGAEGFGPISPVFCEFTAYASPLTLAIAGTATPNPGIDHLFCEPR
jgi:hypothetical protein